MNLFEVFVKIGAKDEASGTISKIASGLGKGLVTAAKAGTAAVTAVTAAAGAMSAAFIKGTSDVAQYGDSIDKMSQKMGLSAEAYQEWDFIMQHSGTSMESLKAGMKTLANAVESGNDAFSRLGITQEQIASMNNEELFSATISALQNVENETERTYLAGQLLGRGATELGALLNTSAEDTEAMRKQVHELGGVMSDEAVKAAAAYQDSLQNMQTAFSGIKRGMLSEFLPSMVTVMDGLSLIFSGKDSGIAKITEGVNKFADKLMETVPKISELGEGILSSLATAILDNLPTLTTTAAKVIAQLFDGIVSALPQIAEGAIEIVRSLTKGLSDNLRTIINSAVELINVLANGILEMLPQIVQVGLDLIVSLANGITESLPALISTVVGVVLQIVNTLTNPASLTAMIESALDLILALVHGLMDAIPQLIAAVPQLVGAITATIITELPNIIAAAVEIVVALIHGLMEALPELMAYVPNLIIAITNGLLNNLGTLISGGVQLLLAIAQGMIQAIPDMVAMIPRIIASIVDTFRSYNWSSIGKNIVAGMKQGVANAWKNFREWFKNLFGDLTNIAKKILGIASPSKVFKKIGQFTTEGLAIGIEQGGKDAFSAIKDVSQGVIDNYGASVSSGFGVSVGTSSAKGVSLTLNIDTFNNYTQEDIKSLAERLSEMLANAAERKAGAYA